MSTPSLLLVPARIKAGGTFLGTPGILYSQIPTNGDGDFRLQRDGLFQTRYNDQGLIERVGTNNNVNVIPRLDYYTSSGTPGCPALLVEPSGTNLCLQSENFLTTWSTAGTNITVTTGSTAAFTAPDGTTSADLLTASANGSARIIQSFTFVSGTTYTYSAFAKAGSGFFGLTMENNGVGSGVAVIWNLNTGALAVSGVVGAGYTLQSQGIENYGNGWYRCRMTVLLGLNVAGNIRANTSDGTMSSAVINSASGNTAYIWGAQLETGSVVTSYIPTTTAQRTRNADVISVSGAVSGSIGQTEGTIYLDFSTIVGTNSNVIFALGDSGTGQNRLRILGNASRELRFIFQLNGNLTQYDFVRTGAVTSLTDFKIAIAYKSGDIAVAINGVLVNTASSGLTFNGPLNSVELSAATVGFLTQRYRAVALYTTRLTNADLTLLTMPGNDTYLPQAVWNNYLSRAGNTEVPNCLYTRHADLLDV
jgi:hypothetical protein